MNFAQQLRGLAHRREYAPSLEAGTRWGQMLREHPGMTRTLTQGRQRGCLVELGAIARVFGGVVTRANSYFLVRELEHKSIPARFGLTKRDLRQCAVVVDGKETAHRIERQFLRPVVKGPEMLLGPDEIEPSDLRVFDVRVSKSELRGQRANGAIEYLHRGETEDYKVSEDTLKGGIPAERANIKTRSPYWYSLSVPKRVRTCIIVPEHFDARYPATLLTPKDERVVLDKLFCVEPGRMLDGEILLAALNSVLTWAQYETRGRTQLGQGVLEVKKADLTGVLVLDPRNLKPDVRRRVLKAFKALRERRFVDASEDVGTPERVAFELEYVQALGEANSDATRLVVERAWRFAATERKERARSLDTARMERGSRRPIDVDVETWAGRVAEAAGVCPDPLLFVPSGIGNGDVIDILHAPAGRIRVGEDLFTKGQVFGGEVVLAYTGDRRAAEFVRGVLIANPETRQVVIPPKEALAVVVANWQGGVKKWKTRFGAEFERLCAGFTDARVRDHIYRRALQLTRSSAQDRES
jgi:hypothetical protein